MRKGLGIALVAIASWTAASRQAEARCPDARLVAQPRAVSGFREIDLAAPAELIIKQGPRESLQVRAEASVLSHIRTTVKDGALGLELDDDGPHQIDCQIIFEVTVVNLAELDVAGAGKVHVGTLTGKQLSLSLSGAADVKLDRLTVEQLSVSMSGAAKVNAAGRATRQKVTISGTGQYKGEQLGGQTAVVAISGTGKARVNAGQELVATISGIGDIEYVGNPQIKQQISGVGKVRPIKR